MERKGKSRGGRILVAVQHERSAREHILDTARSLFNQRGFHQTSMAELASAAKVSVGQIYRLFKGKEDIINAMVSDRTDRRRQELTLLCERLHAGGIDAEEAFELLMLSVIDDRNEALSFDILAEAFRNERVSEAIAVMCVGLSPLMHEFARAANPRLSDEELATAEELILACMFGLGHRSLSRPALSGERAAKGAARMIVAALRGIS